MKEKLKQFMQEHEISWEDIADYNACIRIDGEWTGSEEEYWEERNSIYKDNMEKGGDHITDQLFEECEEDEINHVLNCLLEYIQDKIRWEKENK